MQAQHPSREEVRCCGGSFDHSPLLSWIPLDAIGLLPTPAPPPPVDPNTLPPWQRIQRPIKAACKARAAARMEVELAGDIDELSRLVQPAHLAIDAVARTLDGMPHSPAARTCFLADHRGSRRSQYPCCQ